jgi:exodeoxyribonuclease V alpha subunit
MGFDRETDADGLANFLANHPDVKGIGSAKARLIADNFGAHFDAAIRNLPETGAAIAKARVEAILDLQRIWIANSDFNAAMAYLSRFGLTHHQVTTLVRKFGSHVVPILQNDPYVLMREIAGSGFKRVDKIACKMGTPKDLPSGICAGLHCSVLDALDDGDCWVEFEDLLGPRQHVAGNGHARQPRGNRGASRWSNCPRAACLATVRAAGSCRS